MENDETTIMMPKGLTGDWLIDWLVNDGTSVETGDPVAVMEREGERFLALSPSAGIINIILTSPFSMKLATQAIAKVIEISVSSRTELEGDSGMANKKEAYLAKLRDVVKEATKNDFDEVRDGLGTVSGNVSTLTIDVSTLKGDVSTLKGDVSTLKGDVSTLKGDVSTISSGVSALKNHFGIK